MKLFVFDTETTGFVERDGPLEVQPYIVQFSGILLELQSDKTLKEIDRIDAYVKPPISIPFGASQVHGIYDKDVMDKKTVSEQMNTFLSYLNSADMVVGHNIEYDESVINYELQRLSRKGDYNPQKTLCTMKSTVDFCAIPGRGIGFKFPKLNELYKKLFGEYFEGAHSAIYDVEATVRVLEKLIQKGVIQIEENPIMRLF
ncbi:3'-5' exonuclease [Candidatus Peribacteria bacterium]|nr:3'-5' exonuclease [Candidatus Peribacteria bacterium]